MDQEAIDQEAVDETVLVDQALDLMEVKVAMSEEVLTIDLATDRAIEVGVDL